MNRSKLYMMTLAVGVLVTGASAPQASAVGVATALKALETLDANAPESTRYAVCNKNCTTYFITGNTCKNSGVLDLCMKKCPVDPIKRCLSMNGKTPADAIEARNAFLGVKPATVETKAPTPEEVKTPTTEETKAPTTEETKPHKAKAKKKHHKKVKQTSY